MSYNMYQENILDHYRNPRNFGELKPSDLEARDNNPLCGDELTLYIRFGPDQRVADVRFQGKGCAISQASASMLTVLLKGKNLEELQAIDQERIMKLLGIPISPVRMKCALLSLHVLKLALEEGEGGNGHRH
jgi:nitrogen fixation NifU-like protein